MEKDLLHYFLPLFLKSLGEFPVVSILIQFVTVVSRLQWGHV